MADLRVQQAMDDLLAQGWPHEGNVPRREPKTSYNGAEGVPIREEIVWTQGPDIGTRNGYGAVCLNTPDVMIVDLDEEDLRAMPGLFGKTARWVTAGALLGAFAWTWANTGLPHVQGGLNLLVIRNLGWAGDFLLRLAALGFGSYVLAYLWRQVHFARIGGAVGWLRKQLEQHPGRWALYQTPAGARAIRLDRTMDPTTDESNALMVALYSDRLYREMCLRQACYRARLTPKPWRIHLDRWRGPVWPVEGNRLEERKAWVEQYDKDRASWGACCWVEDLGTGPVDPRCRAVRELHDTHALAPGNDPKGIA